MVTLIMTLLNKHFVQNAICVYFILAFINGVVKVVTDQTDPLHANHFWADQPMDIVF